MDENEIKDILTFFKRVIYYIYIKVYIDIILYIIYKSIIPIVY